MFCCAQLPAQPSVGCGGQDGGQLLDVQAADASQEVLVLRPLEDLQHLRRQAALSQHLLEELGNKMLRQSLQRPHSADSKQPDRDGIL